jgi:hypothetical protein
VSGPTTGSRSASGSSGLGSAAAMRESGPAACVDDGKAVAENPADGRSSASTTNGETRRARPLPDYVAWMRISSSRARVIAT